MAKKHKRRKKLSRRERRGLPKQQPEQATSPQAQPAADIPEPESEPLTGDQPEAEAAQPVPVTATFTPSAARGERGIDRETEEVEYPAVRRDLRKLGITIAVLVLIIAGLSVWNDRTGVVGDVGNWLFSFWQ